MTKLNGNFPSDPITLEKQIPGIGPYTAGEPSSRHALHTCKSFLETFADSYDKCHRGHFVHCIQHACRAGRWQCDSRSVSASLHCSRSKSKDYNRPPLVRQSAHKHLIHSPCEASSKSHTTTRHGSRKLAQDLIHPEAPGDFNQALMDLGATICTPTGPVPCSKCPISRQCHAYAEWTQKKHTVESNVEPSGKNCSLCLPSNDIEDGYAVTRYPVKVMRKEQKTVTSIFYIFEKPALTADSESSFLFTQRPSKGKRASWLAAHVSFEHCS